MNIYKKPLKSVPLLHQGKTRDTYDLGVLIINGEQVRCLLVVTTDRISTHNVVHQNSIPHKGWILNAMTVYWLVRAMSNQPWRHHLLVHGASIYDHLPGKRDDYPSDLHLRAVIVRKLDMVPCEFIHRAYLTGSLFELYKEGEDPYCLELSPGLPRMASFDRPAFTPTRKSEHDEPLDHRLVMHDYPAAYTLTRRVFSFAREHLLGRGLDLVDSKFEVGIYNGELYLGDEAVTVDSSRIIRCGEAREGEEPKWLDKQIARDQAMRIWNGGPKWPIHFGQPVKKRISDQMMDTFALVAGETLEAFQRTYLN